MAGKRSTDHVFKLHLTSSDREVSVELVVTFTATYPKTRPTLVLKDGVYLQEKYRERVDAILENTPKSLLGSPMIYDVASSIQDVLEEYAEARQRGKDLPSWS